MKNMNTKFAKGGIFCVSNVSYEIKEETVILKIPFDDEVLEIELDTDLKAKTNTEALLWSALRTHPNTREYVGKIVKEMSKDIRKWMK